MEKNKIKECGHFSRNHIWKKGYRKSKVIQDYNRLTELHTDYQQNN